MDTIDLTAKHLVLGFGATGVSIAKTLAHIGVRTIWAIDNRQAPPNIDEMQDICTQVMWGKWAESLLDDCDYLWFSPGVPLATAELQTTLSRLPKSNVGGDIELFARLQTSNIIGITGTNGKSTVTTVVGSIFKAAHYSVFMGGNLGLPALDLWLQYQADGKPDNSVFILELSSFQLETTQHLHANIGVILNIAPDHLDRYDSYEHYWQTKFSLFDQAQLCIRNYDDEILKKYSAKSDKKMIEFSLKSSPCEWYLDSVKKMIYHQQNPFISLEKTHLGGLHNLSNLMVSIAIAHHYGVDKNAIKEGIESYEPLAHRTVLVREIAGVRYYNDSKATNIASTEAAITGFSEPKWLILGGVTKGQDFSVLKNILGDDIKGIYIIGENVADILSEIPEYIPYTYVKNLEKAIDSITKKTVKGDIVLFSPACASFDQYKSFEDRGEAFTALINAI